MHLMVRAHRIKSAKLCGKGTLIGVAPCGTKAVVIPKTCKSWDCSHCQPIKTARWVEIAEAGKPERFVTLTCDANRFETPEAAAVVMVKKFGKLVEKIRKKYGSFEYIRTIELHKSGYPHLHILSRGTFISQQWLSDTWDALGVGKIVDIRKIKNPAVTTKYVLKYMGKTVGKLARMWAGIRIITKSQNWLAKGWVRETPPNLIEYEWHAVKDPYWMVLSDLASCDVREISFNRHALRAELDLSFFNPRTKYSSVGAGGHILNARAALMVGAQPA